MERLTYLYNYNYNTQTSSIKMFNLKTEETIRENFITDGTVIKTPIRHQHQSLQQQCIYHRSP